MTSGAEKIASGINGLLKQLDVVSHNVANAQTAGFKKRLLTFHQEYQKRLEALRGDCSVRNVPIRTDQAVDFSQGTLIQTERPLDLGLEGRGFLTVQTSGGPLYTRSGCLRINKLGQLTDLGGRIVSGDNGPINLPPGTGEVDLQISSDGMIRAGGAEMGKLRLADFGDQEDRLIPAGMGVFAAPADLRPNPAVNLKIRQGYQEGSNVQMVGELVNMVSLSRMYEANMNVLKRQQENAQTVLGVANVT
jgi:flagellar basal body rod protein FlgG